MMLKLMLAVFALSVGAIAHGQARWQPVPPLKDPALLNIGFVCRWDSHCITKQRAAMRSSLRFVDATKPPAWKLQLCNRQSSRNGTRKDWIGFNRCIRNARTATARHRR
jgi:hypothetical protein